MFKKQLRSALIGFPTEEDARAMRVPYARLDRIFWDTLDVDFHRLYAFNERMLKLMRGTRTIRTAVQTPQSPTPTSLPGSGG